MSGLAAVKPSTTAFWLLISAGSPQIAYSIVTGGPVYAEPLPDGAASEPAGAALSGAAADAGGVVLVGAAARGDQQRDRGTGREGARRRPPVVCLCMSPPQACQSGAVPPSHAGSHSPSAAISSSVMRQASSSVSRAWTIGSVSTAW